ncbi:hypothetical protein [Halobaculum gomorrense]|uniref:Uncharacterized protein n=1 Tax=Halobaculum gomorrense TaxID=43928 RepID=A0A1M5S391_9EURY|nr:hypothetical protein [Halobaculum gomorrense]SHH32433.1 hypothetical protein SAMN05443636_2309 [Halobaculum gomorrense]
MSDDAAGSASPDEGDRGDEGDRPARDPRREHDDVIATRVESTRSAAELRRLRAADPAVSDDLAALGDDDETGRAVEWRERLPDGIYGGDWTARVYGRIVG